MKYIARVLAAATHASIQEVARGRYFSYSLRNIQKTLRRNEPTQYRRHSRASRALQGGHDNDNAVAKWSRLIAGSSPLLAGVCSKDNMPHKAGPV